VPAAEEAAAAETEPAAEEAALSTEEAAPAAEGEGTKLQAAADADAHELAAAGHEMDAELAFDPMWESLGAGDWAVKEEARLTYDVWVRVQVGVGRHGDYKHGPDGKTAHPSPRSAFLIVKHVNTAMQTRFTTGGGGGRRALLGSRIHGVRAARARAGLRGDWGQRRHRAHPSRRRRHRGRWIQCELR